MSDSVFEFEIVVVGGGPAGLAAACAAAESGRSVCLVEGTPWLGGQIWRGEPLGAPESLRRISSIKTGKLGGVSPTLPEEWLSRFHNSGASVLERTSVIAAPSPGVILAEHDDGPREIRWNRLVLATGARELFLPFPGWTLPGVVGPGGLQAMVKNGWPVTGQRVVIAGSGPLLLAVADGLAKHGARIVSIAEQAPRERVFAFGLQLCLHPEKVWQGLRFKLRLRSIPYRFGTWPVCAEGGDEVRRVKLTNGQRTWTEECDLFACGFGLVPNIELASMMGCDLNDGNVKVDEWQATTAADVYCAGEPTGIGGVDCALVEGQIAGYVSAGQTEPARKLFKQREGWHHFRAALVKAFALRAELKSLATDEMIVCRCEDVCLGKLRGFSSWREAKLQSRCGMGTCQGRVCGAATKFILDWGMESVRPPILPAKVKSMSSPQGVSVHR